MLEPFNARRNRKSSLITRLSFFTRYTSRQQRTTASKSRTSRLSSPPPNFSSPIEAAALRETEEEAQVTVALNGLYTVFSIPHVSQVYMVFRGTMGEEKFGAGEESLEVRLFNLNQIPWTELAFQVIFETLELYSQDRATGHFPVHVGTIQRPEKS